MLSGFRLAQLLLISYIAATWIIAFLGSYNVSSNVDTPNNNKLINEQK